MELNKSDAKDLDKLIEFMGKFTSKGSTLMPETAKQILENRSSEEIQAYFDVIIDQIPRIGKKFNDSVRRNYLIVPTDYTKTFFQNGGFVRVVKTERRKRIINEIPKWLPIAISICALVVSFLSFIYKVS